MRLISILTYMAAVGVLAAACGVSDGAMVTLDAATQAVSSNTSSLEPKWVKSNGEQIGVYIQSAALTPQNPVLRIANLKPGRYDVYVNWGEFQIERSLKIAEASKRPFVEENIEPGYVIRDKDAGKLADGLSIPIRGRVIPMRLMRCLESVQPKVTGAHKGLTGNITSDPGRARYTLGQADESVRLAIRGDETYRSAQVIVAPSGVPLRPMDWRARLTERGLLKAAEHTCGMLQQARAQMYKVLTDPLLRHTVVEALTPVSMTIRYAASNGVGWARVEITNNCDLDISGAVKVNVPTGWRAKAKKTTFVGLKSGGVWTQAFKLAPISKGQTVRTELPVSATIRVADKNSFAKLRLMGRAELHVD